MKSQPATFRRMVHEALLLGERGFTLVEMMAALVVALLVLGAGFTALLASEKAARLNRIVAHTQQNSRIAMELISRDLKIAGFGMTGPVGNCTINGTAAPIVPLDWDPAALDRGPDSVRMVLPITDSGVGPAWQLNVQAQGPFTVMTLDAGAVAAMVAEGLTDTAPTSIVSIGGAVSSPISDLDTGANTITLTNQVGAPKVFPIGTQLFLLECITYSVSNNAATCGGSAPCLMRDGISIVDGIEDIQLAYACDGCNAAVNAGIPDGIPDDWGGGGGFDKADFVTDSAWNVLPTTPSSIRLVEVTIVARQAQQDQGFSETGTQGSRAISTATPLQISDHDHSDGVFGNGTYNAADYRLERRRVLSRVVQTRNVGP